jgi:hypothetical protein
MAASRAAPDLRRAARWALVDAGPHHRERNGAPARAAGGKRACFGWARAVPTGCHPPRAYACWDWFWHGHGRAGRARPWKSRVSVGDAAPGPQFGRNSGIALGIAWRILTVQYRADIIHDRNIVLVATLGFHAVGPAVGAVLGEGVNNALWIIAAAASLCALYGWSTAGDGAVERNLACRRAALQRSDVQQIMSAHIMRLQTAKRINQLDILDRGGDVLLTTASGFTPPTLLDAGTISHVLNAGKAAALVQQDSSRRFRITVAQPIIGAVGHVTGILAAAVDRDRALVELSEGLGGDAYILSLRNRIAHGTNQALAQTLAFDLPIRQRFIEHRTVVGRTYQIASVPLEDTVGRVVGALITVKDVTTTIARGDRVGLVSGLLVGLGVMLIVTFLV